MRQAPQAWMWNMIQAQVAGSMTEASATAKEAGDPKEPQGLQRRGRGLLPRT